jgi:hypothetical protein
MCSPQRKVKSRSKPIAKYGERKNEKAERTGLDKALQKAVQQAPETVGKVLLPQNEPHGIMPAKPRLPKLCTCFSGR